MSETQGFIEYRVVPVTRFIVTRYERHESADGRTGSATGSRQQGEFPNGETAYAVAYALAREEHERLGYPPGDTRIRYPDPDHGHDFMGAGEELRHAITAGVDAETAVMRAKAFFS